ncbi:cation-translocating P-type ATPase [Mucilaginibacter sp. RS28]|uniref:Cation-translocating P-type ATPase n=1 Tax=Mucilaginibacter straminoryzae TaxID=2932774 RepID=A0A9X1X0G2_9SPHI|nr:cation-translocating P-type ATPase [Mucilaginibacter straminoryzae]MCJ8208356.1 cation-translocating P-type ATPase [Mucilaginibacter straminoryzae]
MAGKSKTGNPFPFRGLSAQEVLTARKQFGENTFGKPANVLWASFKKSFLDPVFLLLILAAVLYLLLNQVAEAVYMTAAVIVIASISFYQENKSGKALDALQKITAPHAKVIRNSEVALIPQQELVVGDYVVAEEGIVLPADGEVVQANDFSVNESLLTGEAVAVFKNTDNDNNRVYQGTTVSSGLAVYQATQVGAATRMGGIAHSLGEIKSEPSPLEKKINRFVTRMSLVGLAVFVMVWAVHYFRSGLLADSLLQALTLAMSILPEEIPVAFSTFMALGAWRLMQKGIIAKDVKTVEALGAATVICLDKTGTITENEMKLEQVYHYAAGQLFSSSDFTGVAAAEVVTYGMWASEPVPFDQMEKTLHHLYAEVAQDDQRRYYHLVHEYPLAGRPPMMTHVFENERGDRIISAKGAPEKIISVAKLTTQETQRLKTIVAGLNAKGYRVLAVAEGSMNDAAFPANQEDFDFRFVGLLAFYDPPKKGINHVFNQFYQAGIAVKIITGDSTETARAIAVQAGIREAEKTMEGNELMALDDEALKQAVTDTTVFTRMYPEAKLKIIQTLKALGHVVAMTGDGVNDAPALKAAHIGIAMGKRGAETAREAASLVLLKDKLDKMVDAIAMGRGISLNLKKAVRYIISIHIPIILIVTIPLMLHWVYPDIFSPVHVVFLELVMGPTCSIAYENEPGGKFLMTMPPRVVTGDLLSFRELGTALVQGLAITAGTLLVYQGSVYLQQGEHVTRALVFIALISSNIFLTLTDRALYKAKNGSRFQRNIVLRLVIIITLLLVAVIFTVPPIRNFFGFAIPAFWLVLTATGVGLLSVMWFDLVKKEVSVKR